MGGLFALFPTLLFSSPSSLPPSPSSSSAPIKVLFIGNSLTAYHDLPGLLERLAEAEGHAVETGKLVLFGKSLKDHWQSGAALRAIHGEAWDYVVLQEMSVAPLLHKATFFSMLALFDSTIEAAGTRTLLFQNWPKATVPGDLARLRQIYREAAEEFGITVVPVGEAFGLARRIYPCIPLYRDAKHPSLAGSSLAAALFYKALAQAEGWALPHPGWKGTWSSLHHVADLALAGIDADGLSPAGTLPFALAPVFDGPCGAPRPRAPAMSGFQGGYGQESRR